MRERIHVSVAENWLTRLCNRRSRGDRTSIRVWCSHVRSAPSYGNHVRTRDRLLTTLGPKGGKKTKNPLSGVVGLLTNGGLIRVRCGMGTRHQSSRLLCCIASSIVRWNDERVFPTGTILELFPYKFITVCRVLFRQESGYFAQDLARFCLSISALFLKILKREQL
jgi:hypothetical protein